MRQVSERVWHVLDTSSVPVEEFASALHTLVPTIAWQRQMSSLAALHSCVRLHTQSDPPLDVALFSQQRGFSKPVLRRVFPFAARLTEALLAQTKQPVSSPLICTSPFYAPVAERWPGPVVYYSTDLTFAYDRLNPKQVLALDRRLCAVAALVCPNSTRIGEYLVQRAHCDPGKIQSVPNATRASSVLEHFPEVASDPPAQIADLPRPIAGVIGNLTENLDWALLETVIERSPWLSWVFVGPTSMAISDRRQREARARVMAARPRVCFVGPKRYASLKDYARSVDVGVLPYFRREPTFSGSPTRFYEHLAACRPMLATRGVEQLLQKEPLVRLIDGPEQMLSALEELRAQGFQDGFERIRWTVSRKETWLERAKVLMEALHATGRLPGTPGPSVLRPKLDAIRPQAHTAGDSGAQREWSEVL